MNVIRGREENRAIVKKILSQKKKVDEFGGFCMQNREIISCIMYVSGLLAVWNMV